MDGYAVRADRTFGAGPDRPIMLTVGLDAWPVNTGRRIPEGTNAVIKIEHVHFLDNEHFEIEEAVVPWQHVRRVGEDFVASEMLLPAHHVITPYEQGALLAGGVWEVEVIEKPRFLLIPTGSELVEARILSCRDPEPGEIVEFNTTVLAGIVHQHGGCAIHHPIVPDRYADIKEAIQKGVRSDAHAVVINAGSSAGSEDYTAAAIRDLGELLVHGVAMMPGKPTILGIVEGKPVIGNPGYPVSAVFSFEIFGVALIEEMLGVSPYRRPTAKAITARKLPSKLGSEEIVRLKLGKVADRLIAASLPRGAGSITTLSRADGLLKIPASSEGLEQGSLVDVELLRPISEINRTVVNIGSHDLTLDILGDLALPRRVYFSSSHVGSLGGLMALRNGVSHTATSHLLDFETGEYNWPFIRRYLPNLPVRLFHVVMREQGFMVRKGNPKSILSVHDLVRDDVTFVNRQAGAGTRVLLDYYLEREKIDPTQIKGYDLEEYTHTSVAVAVLSGVADVGMGVFAAARALGLDFVPLATEQYDLVIPEQFLSDEKIQVLLEIIRGKAFQERVRAMGGYGTDRSGEEIPPKS